MKQEDFQQFILCLQNELTHKGITGRVDVFNHPSENSGRYKFIKGVRIMSNQGIQAFEVYSTHKGEAFWDTYQEGWL